MRRLRLNEQVSPAIMQLISIGLIPRDIRPKPGKGKNPKKSGTPTKGDREDREVKNLKEIARIVKKQINYLKRRK